MNYVSWDILWSTSRYNEPTLIIISASGQRLIKHEMQQLDILDGSGQFAGLSLVSHHRLGALIG